MTDERAARPVRNRLSLIAPLFIYLIILIFALLLISANMVLDWNGIYIYKEAFACFINKFNQGKARLIENMYTYI